MNPGAARHALLSGLSAGGEFGGGLNRARVAEARLRDSGMEDGGGWLEAE